MALKKLVSDLTEGLTAYPNSNTPSDSGGFNYGGSTSIFDTKVFNQRSVPYSQPLSRQDNPEPLIPQILPGVNQEPNESTIFITDSPDGFIRGGKTNAIKRAATDTVRMNKFFISGEGISFISNQKALQRSNPLIQEGGGNIGNILEDLLNGSIGTGFNFNNTNRTFNEGNLIKQISEGGYTGNYFNRAGSNPEIQAATQNKYEATHKPGRKFDANKFGKFSNQGGLESGNRLISLGKKLGAGTGLSFDGSGGDSLMKTALGFDVGTFVDTFDNIKNNFNQFLSNPLESLSQPGPFSPNQEIGFKPGENIIYQYSGGPGSTYGVGDTILYRYERTSGDFDHQGHPLSFSKYYELQNNTTNKASKNDFGNLLTSTVNNNLFGGNKILGPGGLLSSDNIIKDLSTQIFGEQTVGFATDLFNNGIGAALPGLNEQVARGSYSIGGMNSLEGIRDGFLSVVGDISGNPTSGFIKHTYRSPSNTDGTLGFSTEFKPDDVATSIEKGIEPAPTIGKVIGSNDYLKSVSGYLINPINPTQISKEGRKRLGEDGSTNVTDAYDGEHYYSKILSQKVDNDSGRNYTFESRLGAGRPGTLFEGKLNNQYSVTTNKDQRIDKINALDIHRVTDGTFDNVAYRDLIRFRFEAIDTDNPTEVDAMVFRAFLDGYGDSYNSEWNSFKYNGRGEDFYTYGGFKRSVNFSFKIAAQSRFEMKPLYRKLNYLATTLAPDYEKGGSGVMRGNYIRVTIGALLDRVPGFLTSMDIKWQKDYPFEIAIANPETGGTDSEMQVLPHVLDINCNFTPIHDFIPRKSITDSPFFAKTSGDNGTPRDFYKDGIIDRDTAKNRTTAGSTSNPLPGGLDNDGDGIPNFIDPDFGNFNINNTIGDFVSPTNFNNIV